MVLKISEQVRRLEDTIESLRRDNQELRDKLKKQEPRLNYKGNINSFNDLPSEGNEEGDFYTYKIYDKLLDERCIGKYVRYKSKWIDLDRVIESEADERDEIIDHQKWEISKLKTELSARLKQVEDLQSSYKTLQKENERLKSKLEQTVDEYDEEYKTFHDVKDDDINYDKRLEQHMRDIMKSRLDDIFNKGRW